MSNTQEKSKKYFRNTARLTLASGEVVDQGSLWEEKDDQLILVDDDRYIEHDITTVFVKINL